MIFLKKNWLIVILVLTVFLTRLLILNEYGIDFWADERHYRQLISTLEESKQKNNYMLAISTVFHLNARPMLGVLYYPAAFLEWKNPHIPFGAYFNLIINTLSIILIFLIIKKMLSIKAAIFATLIVTFSVASVIYIRHLIPYDLSLFLLILGFYLYIKSEKLFLFGIFAGLSFLTYPSYYYIFPIPAVLALYYKSIIKPSIFSIGVVTALVVTHLFSLLLREMLYFPSLLVESKGATDHYGDFMPAVAYITEYIVSVDGYWNLLLILIILPGLFLIRNNRNFLLFGSYLLITFLVLEASSNILHKNVLYGRTIRPFYLIALTFAFLVIERILSNLKSRKIYLPGLLIITLLTFINWIPNFLTYKNLVYPRQFQQKAESYLAAKNIQTKIENAPFVNYWGEPPPSDFYSPPRSNFFKPGQKGKFYTINADQTFPYYGNYNLDIFCKHEVLFKEPHIQSIFKPYLFEGHKRVMREAMARDPLYYQLIYCQL